MPEKRWFSRLKDELEAGRRGHPECAAGAPRLARGDVIALVLLAFAYLLIPVGDIVLFSWLMDLRGQGMDGLLTAVVLWLGSVLLYGLWANVAVLWAKWSVRLCPSRRIGKCVAAFVVGLVILDASVVTGMWVYFTRGGLV